MAFYDVLNFVSDFWLISRKVMFGETSNVHCIVVDMVEYWVKVFIVVVGADAIYVCTVDSYGVLGLGRCNVSNEFVVTWI